jgi:hypothetical protein
MLSINKNFKNSEMRPAVGGTPPDSNGQPWSEDNFHVRVSMQTEAHDHY